MDRMLLPDDLAMLMAGRAVTRDVIGCSQAGVFRLDGDGGPLWLKAGPEGGGLGHERQALVWLSGKLNVPQVLHWSSRGGFEFLLMSDMPGEIACASAALDAPLATIRLLAEGLKQLWAVDLASCPLDNRLGRKLEKAQRCIDLGLVDTSDWEPDTMHGSPEALLDWLIAHRPASEELCFTHGDYCLPNIFLKDGAVSGFIDMGNAGLADRWQDIALCVRSLHHNFHTDDYDGYLFYCLGIKPDWEKIRYYILLDELF